MRRTLQHWLIVTLLTLAVGGHWVMLQSVAWMGMAISYAQTDTLKVALVKTFDGNHPCTLCRVVQAGKRAGKTTDTQRVETKVDFFLVTRQVIIFSRPPTPFQTAGIRLMPARAESPPTPPPRLLLG